VKREQGFIFIEVLIAVIIISIGIVAAGAVFIPSTASYAQAADYTVATNLAQKQLELLKTWDADSWRNALLLGTIEWQGEEPQPNMPLNLNGVDYTVETKVSDASVSNALVEVTVTIFWSRGGKAQSAEFIAYYSKV
jgi:type II secretory pathway pseudopilin PulG